MGSKNREDLCKLFKTGNKPTEDDFADLIDSMVNIAEDGIGVSEKGEPMELIYQGTNQRWLDFSSGKDSPVWRINARSGSGVTGLNVATADSTSRLYIQRETGFIGVNNDAPDAQLHIAAASGTALQVDYGDDQTALVIDADGHLGIGTTSSDDFQVTVDGKVKLQGETTIASTVYAQKGLNVSGAALTAQQGVSIQNGATIESGLLKAKAGLTVEKTLIANDGAIVSGLALQAKNGLNVTNGAVIESGKFEAKAGGLFSGDALVASEGFTASKGAVISGGQLEVRADATVSGGKLTAGKGLTVTNGAEIQTGALTAQEGLTVNKGAEIQTGMLTAQEGLTVNKGVEIKTGTLTAQEGLTVNKGAEIKTGTLTVQEGLTVNKGAEIKTGTLTVQEGLTVNKGAEIKTGMLTAREGLTVNGATVIENGRLTAKGGLTVANGSAFTAEGQVVLGNSESGDVACNGSFFAKQGLKVENAELEAVAGAVVSGAELLVEQGLTVSNGATFETGMLTAKGGVTVSKDATLSATGPVTLGNAADGMVTVNGGLKATNGAVVSGAELVAANGLNVTGTLNVSGTATISTLSVGNIDVSGNLGLQGLDLGSVTAEMATIGVLTVEDVLQVAAPCLLMDSILVDTGMIYVSYQGPAGVQPRLKVVQGTVTEAGHFGITVDENKVLTITYAENAQFKNLAADWEKYQAAQLTLTAGFKLITIGDHYWELQDREIDFTATEPYRQYINTETGLCVIYTVATDNAPQFKITANDNTTVNGFEFEIVDQNLTIKYPAAQENCTVTKLISDWDTLISGKLENSGNFELRKTADSTGEAVVTDIASTTLEVNTTGNVYNKAILKTNSVNIKGNLKLGDSDLEVSGVSDNTKLVENSDAYLPTQKAVKTYVDNGLDLKADLKTMTTELAKKADADTMTTELAKKADADTMTTELAKKADTTTMTTELDKKADLSTVKEELAKKVDQSAMLTGLAAKAGLITANDITLAPGETGPVREIALTADSRGLLLLRTITAAGTANAGLFALHRTDSILKITGDGMTTQKDNSSTCNLYLANEAITIQNSLAEAVTITASYFGV